MIQPQEPGTSRLQSVMCYYGWWLPSEYMYTQQPGTATNLCTHSGTSPLIHTSGLLVLEYLLSTSTCKYDYYLILNSARVRRIRVLGQRRSFEVPPQAAAATNRGKRETRTSTNRGRAPGRGGPGPGAHRGTDPLEFRGLSCGTNSKRRLPNVSSLLVKVAFVRVVSVASVV